MNEINSIDSSVIEQTKNWLKSIIIGLGFCPFAQQELERNRIHYCVVRTDNLQACLESLVLECERLDGNKNIATSLLIYPDRWADFNDFLDYLALAESLLEAQKYQGIYQLASFHPLYRFEGAPEKDPANYTNRSPHPMLHLLREDGLEIALKQYPHPEQIPHRNIQRARTLGETKLKILLDGCRSHQKKHIMFS